MAFTTRRGRPKQQPQPPVDLGTPELRLKHALRLTTEPIDLCLEKQLISEQQHWCGLHLRWLYTLRYGAPRITTRYADHTSLPAAPPEDAAWRSMREREYHDATRMLKAARRYECVMRLAVFNETPAFLSRILHHQAWHNDRLADALHRSHQSMRHGLELLVTHWRISKT